MIGSKQWSHLSRMLSRSIVPVVGLALGACVAESPVGVPELEPSFGAASDGTAGTGLLLCKYTPEATSQAFKFRVSANGGDVVGNGRVTLNSTQSFDITPECSEAWVPTDGAAATVTIEELTPDGWELFGVYHNQSGWVDPLQNPVDITPVPGVTNFVLFKNRPTEFDVALGRMTGGGGQVAVGDVHITRGFTIHCDITLSNNVEVNWEGNSWHIDKPLTSAICIDDPAIEPAPPPAPFDTFIGEATGRLNNVDGSIIRFTFIDAGEPGGHNDRATINIWAPGADPDVDVPVVSVDGFLDHGNLQAHYDQPHR